jgi:hypothetical protein
MRENRRSNEAYKASERIRLRERQARRRAEDPFGEYLKRRIRENNQLNRRDQEVLDGYTEAQG